MTSTIGDEHEQHTSPPTTPKVTTDQLVHRVRLWVRSPEVRDQFRVEPPIFRWILSGILCLTIVGIPIGIAKFIVVTIFWNIRRNRYVSFVAKVDRSQPIWVCPIMVNKQLLQRPGTVAPGLVIGSFEPSVPVEYYESLLLLFDQMSSGQKNGDDATFVQGLFNDENFVAGRRRLLPESLTCGVRIYAFDTMINSDHLAGAAGPHGLIACVAEPGQSGQIVTVPNRLFAGWENGI